MSVRVMTEVWALELADSQKIVLLALADCANDEGHCWPSMLSLARKCSKGQRTVQGVVKSLVDAGHVTRREVPGRGCEYWVHPRKAGEPSRTPAEPAPRSHRAPQRSRPAVTAPRNDCATPPQPLLDTPAAAADKPSENHQEPSKDSPPVGEPFLTIDEIVDAWNDLAARCGLVRVAKLTDERRRKARLRAKRFSIDEWALVLRKIEQSPFLRGASDRGWRADFDFILSEGNFVKILEGKYDQQPTT
jgi:hypothetical protein